MDKTIYYFLIIWILFGIFAGILSLLLYKIKFPYKKFETIFNFVISYDYLDLIMAFVYSEIFFILLLPFIDNKNEFIKWIINIGFIITCLVMNAIVVFILGWMMADAAIRL